MILRSFLSTKLDHKKSQQLSGVSIGLTISIVLNTVSLITSKPNARPSSDWLASVDIRMNALYALPA